MTFFSLPIVVTRTILFVAVSTRRNTKAFAATLEAKEHAWLFVRRR